MIPMKLFRKGHHFLFKVLLTQSYKTIKEEFMKNLFSFKVLKPKMSGTTALTFIPVEKKSG